jgi:hypothetical protein
LGEFVTIPSLPESSDWQIYANARQALLESKKRGYRKLRIHFAENITLRVISTRDRGLRTITVRQQFF